MKNLQDFFAMVVLGWIALVLWIGPTALLLVVFGLLGVRDSGGATAAAIIIGLPIGTVLTMRVGKTSLGQRLQNLATHQEFKTDDERTRQHNPLI